MLVADGICCVGVLCVCVLLWFVVVCWLLMYVGVGMLVVFIVGY